MRHPTIQHFPQVHQDDETEVLEEETWTPLQLAAAEGNVNLVTSLIRNGADVNDAPIGWYGKTALQAAALHGHIQIVDALLQAGAVVDAAGGNNGGRTALVLAAGAAGIDNALIVKRLLDAGANVNPPIHKYMGRSPAQAAAEGGNLDVLKLLVAHGADIKAPSALTSGRSALQGAAERQHVEVVDYLLAQGALENDDQLVPRTKVTLTALQAASSMGHVDIVRKLLAAGADVNVCGSRYKGFTALYGAAEAGHCEIIKILLAAGADVTQLSGDHGWTPRRAAMYKGWDEAAELLRDAEVSQEGKRLN